MRCVKLSCDSSGHISRRVRLVQSVATHVAESAAPLSLPLMIVCHGAKKKRGVVQRVSKLAQIAHTDEVFKHREVSCVKYCTSQLNVRKLLVNAMDSVKKEVDQVSVFTPMEGGMVPRMHDARA